MSDEMGLVERLTYFHFNNVEADRATMVTIETAALRDANELFVSAAVALKTAQQQLAAKDAAIERLAAEAREALPSFEGVAKTKLDALKAQGWEICGYAIVKDGQYGLVTTGAFVGWWSVAADNADRAEAQRDKLKEALTKIDAAFQNAVRGRGNFERDLGWTGSQDNMGQIFAWYARQSLGET